MTSSPGPLLDRQRLAGEHRLVDRRRALDHDAVDRDLLAGPDPQQVADADGVERRRRSRCRPRPAERSRGWSPIKPPDGAGRLVLGPRLEPATEQHQADDDRSSCRSRSPGAARPRGRRRATGSRRRCSAQAALVPTATRVSMFVVPWRAARQAARVEPPPGPDLDERRGHEREPVDGRHRDDGLRPEHHEHQAAATAIETSGLDQQVAALGGARSAPSGSIARGRAVAGASRVGRRSPPPRSRRRPRRGRRAPDRRVTVARSVARLTLASRTPSVLRRNRSIRLTHDAQVMPSIGRTISMGRWSAVAVGWRSYSR